MSIERSGAAILIECLKRQGVEFVFGYPGGAVLPIYDELFADDGIRHILVRHEAGAAHAAEGYARSTGKPGVVLVTSGPGATNAVTGIADAYMDSIPMVVITGQVPTALIGTDAFQEADTIGLTRHCTKHNYLVKDPERLGATIEEAFRIATSGRPGPVVVDIPKDVQIALANWDGQDESPLPSHRYQPRMVGAADEIAEAVEMLAVAMAADGKSALSSAANCVRTPPEVILTQRNIMGVVVPSIEVSQIQKSVEERGYGLIGTSVRVDEAVHAFEILAAKILEAAELETTMKKLLDEIESTKRRVNALEFKIIPQLEEIASYITLRLEELERENIFRLKRIKG